MCGGGPSYSPPPLPPLPPPPDPPAETNTTEQKSARRNERKAQLAAMGRQSTILTGALGDTSTPAKKKNDLLGQ